MLYSRLNPVSLSQYIPPSFDPPLDVLRVSDVVLGDVLEAVVSDGWYRSNEIETKRKFAIFLSHYYSSFLTNYQLLFTFCW